MFRFMFLLIALISSCFVTQGAISDYSVLIFSVPEYLMPNAFLGTGTIITNRHVLTAAHVVNTARRILIGHGSEDFTKLRQYETPFYMTHPRFNVATNENDIAIVFLNRQEFTLPRNFIFPSMGSIIPSLGDRGIVTSFGYNSDINSVNMKARVQEITVGSENYCKVITKNTITPYFCGYDLVNRPPAILCFGDNGAGLIREPNGATPNLVGVVSITSMKCKSATVVPVAFTPVAPYVEWIESITSQLHVLASPPLSTE